MISKLRQYGYSVALVGDKYHVSKDGFNWAGVSLNSAQLYDSLRMEYAQAVLGHTSSGEGEWSTRMCGMRG